MQPERRPLILVVDDDRLSRQMMQDVLAPLGYEVATAADGAAAVAQAEALRPDLVVMDVVMPVRDGFDACAAIKAGAATSHIPVVLVTSLDGRDAKIRGLAAGANDFIAKPVDEAELVLRAKNLLRIVEAEDALRRHNESLDAEVRLRTRALEETLARLARSEEQLRQSYQDTIVRLTTVAEYKDGFTAAHIRRVGHYCRHVARELGWGAEDQDAIYHASPMHDIGKVCIPTEILLKPGPLSPEEYNLAKTHTSAGARILRGSSSAWLQLAETIALTHHERHDGGGYPHGLAADEIPAAGMIMSIADQYEALRSERPYKPAFSHEQAVAVITRGDGRTLPSHFHPRILQAFADTAAKFAEIFEEFSPR